MMLYHHLSAIWTCKRPGRAAVQPRSEAASKAHVAGEGGPGAQLPCAETTLSTAPAMPALMVYGPACQGESTTAQFTRRVWLVCERTAEVCQGHS